MQLIALLFACADKTVETDTATEVVIEDTATEDTGEVSEPEAQPEPEPAPEPESQPEDTDNTVPTEPAVVTIEDIQQGALTVGTEVTLENVVVSSPSNGYGFYITSASGGPYSGMFVYYYFDSAIALNIEQGDIINITGEVWEYPDTCEDGRDNDEDDLIDENDPDCADGGQEIVLSNFQTMTELKLLDPSMISKTGETATDIPITIVDSSVLTVDETAEAYEGVLVRIENGTVTHDLNDDGQWKIDDVMVDDLFDYRPGLVNIGDSFDTVQGILHFSHGDYKIVPRGDSDVSGWNRTCSGQRCIWEAEAGEVVVTEFMANPHNDGTCSDGDGEYIEVQYTTTSGDSLDLRGMKLADAGNDVLVENHVVLNPGESAWLSVGEESCYGTPRAYLGGTSFSLNNSGDDLTLSFVDTDQSITIFDMLTYTGSWVDVGISIQLDPSKTNATDNDDMSNWCPSTQEISTTTDLGTPGLENTSCF